MVHNIDELLKVCTKNKKNIEEKQIIPFAVLKKGAWTS